jgi:hypothetical protein
MKEACCRLQDILRLGNLAPYCLSNVMTTDARKYQLEINVYQCSFGENRNV